MLFVGTSIIHPSTEGVFLLCNILDLLIYSYEDMLIAGVPALYRITNGKITEFYFDSVEIEEFFNSMGR